MCDPVSVTLATVAMASAGMKIKGQNDMAEARGKAVATGASNSNMALANKQQEINSASSLEQLERERQGLRERSTMKVASGEAGSFGNSAVRELANSMFQTSFDTGIMENNRENSIKQTQREKEAASASAKSEIAGLNFTGPLMGALQIGAAGAMAGVGGFKPAAGLTKTDSAATGDIVGNNTFRQ